MGLCEDPVSTSLHTEDKLSLDRPCERRLGAGGGGPNGLFTPKRKNNCNPGCSLRSCFHFKILILKNKQYLTNLVYSCRCGQRASAQEALHSWVKLI